MIPLLTKMSQKYVSHINNEVRILFIFKEKNSLSPKQSPLKNIIKNKLLLNMFPEFRKTCRRPIYHSFTTKSFSSYYKLWFWSAVQLQVVYSRLVINRHLYYFNWIKVQLVSLKSVVDVHCNG